MNKKFFIAALFGLAIAASCQKEQLREQEERPVEQVEFSAMTEAGSVSTKLSLGVGLKPEWKDADEIAVYDQSKIQQFFVYESEGSQAKFTGKVTEGAAEFSAVYPYSAAKSFADGKFTVEIPAEQVIEAGDSADASALLAVAQASRTEEGVHLSFRNVCGLIQVKIPQSGKISAVVIKGKGDETLAGEGVVTISDAPSIALSATASKTVTLRPAGEDATFEAGTYYAAVAPVKFASGFTISLVRTDGAAGLVGTDLEMEVVRNGGKGLDDIVAISDWSWIIYTREQLQAWNKGDRKKTDYVELGADIDMQGETWVPHAFSGTFDGKGHKIYNFVVDTSSEEYKNVERKYASFITDCSGKLMNLIIGSKDGETYDGVSEFLLKPLEDDPNWAYVGVIGKISGAQGIENVKNFSKLTIAEGTQSIKFSVGGISAMINGKSPVTNCVNNGDISVLNTGAPKDKKCIIGGITGKFDYEGSITGCVNNGDILNKHTGVWAIGGIVGNTNAREVDIKPNIATCANYGDISVMNTTSTSSPMGVGGIAGRLHGAKLSECTNDGSISSVCNVLTGIGGIAGIHALEYESIIDKCVNGAKEKTDKGLLTFNPSEGTEQMVLGGILGYSKDYKGKLIVSACDNHAPITTSYACLRNIGGICGAIGNVTAKDGGITEIDLLIDDCHNYGAIKVGGSASYSGWQRNIGGIIGMLHGSETGVTVRNCSNNATIHTTASDGGENRPAGISGNTRYGKIVVSSCNNNAEVKATGAAKNPRPAGIISVAQTAISTEVSDCTNNGTITSASSVGNSRCGGIVGYSQGLALSGCSNKGLVTATLAGGEVLLGGLVGTDNTSTTLTSCTNDTEGQVICTGAGANSYVGGLLGSLSAKGSVTQSHNKGLAKMSLTNQHCNVGGIAGYSSGAVSQCTNASTGKVIVEHKGANAKYAVAGGMVGRGYKGSSIAECVNYGIVEAAVNTNNKLTGAGGMLGQAQNAVSLTNNSNYGEVKGSNTNAAAQIYVGGIVATDGENLDHTGATTVTGNANYGIVTLSAETPSVANGLVNTVTGAAAGGIFGLIVNSTMPTAEADYNVNYGIVIAEKGKVEGAAGALAGASSIASWTAKVGKGTIVNGIPWSEEVSDSWLCPSAVNPLSAIYVDQPVNE